MVVMKMPTTVMIKKMAAKSLGNPKMAAGLPDGDDRIVWLGTFIGIASGVKKVVDQQDETKISYALKGQFEGIPDNTDAQGNPLLPKFCKPVMRSPLLWLPEGFHDMVVDAVTGGDPNTKMPNIIKFSARIGTRKETHASGYSYVVGYQSDVAASDDPLAELRGQVLQLSAPTDDVETVETATETVETVEPVTAETVVAETVVAEVVEEETGRGRKRR